MSFLRSALNVWSKPVVKKGVVMAILLTTVVIFIHFFMSHPEYWQRLKEVSLSTIGVVLGFNLLLIFILSTIYRTSVQICGKEISPRENFLITAYSSVINFFGPLQSGPGVRAVYLKTRLHIRLRDYTLITLLYYGIFAVINIGFLFAGTRPWWQTFLALLAGIFVSSYVFRTFRRRDNKPTDSQLSLRPKLVGVLIVLTLLQVVVLCLMYYFELLSINTDTSFTQAISYTGAADLALFVSLTPGAVGFRESFLYFSQSLHHISTADILSANLIDRAVYVLFLILLLGTVLILHAGKKLRQLTGLPKDSAKS